MGSMLVSSTISGQQVTRTGRYKVFPITGSILLAIALGLLSTLRVDSPIWLACLFMGVMGIGLGMSMQILTLIVQNSFPVREVGTATASTQYFRQVGATLGTAVVGSLFTTRLVQLVTEKLPAGAGPADGAVSLTPELVNSMPDQLREVIVQSYNEALIPVFLYMVPLALLAAGVLLFVKENDLATTVEDEVVATEPQKELVGADRQRG